MRSFELPFAAHDQPAQITLRAEVRQLTAEYHGHGVWMQMMRTKQD
jgi:hypothetical protein